MADQTVSESQALQPQEYLKWVLSLEHTWGLASGIRAYLVQIEDDGRRRLSPVKNCASVVCLEDDLISHLTNDPKSTEFYQSLHQHCEQVLARRAVVINRDREDLAALASWEIESNAAAALKLLPDDTEWKPVKTLLRRIESLSQAQMSALTDDLEKIERIRNVIED